MENITREQFHMKKAEYEYLRDLTERKFLTHKIDYAFLDKYFYNDLDDGEYLVVDAVKCRYDISEFFFLLYNESQKKLIKLYPCRYTRKKMKEYYGWFHDYDALIYILQKGGVKRKTKKQRKRPPVPKWRDGCVSDYFLNGQMFRPVNYSNSVELVTKRLLPYKAIIEGYIQRKFETTFINFMYSTYWPKGNQNKTTKYV